MDRIDKFLSGSTDKQEQATTGRTSASGKKNLNKRKTIATLPEASATSTAQAIEEQVAASPSIKKKVFLAPETNKAISFGLPNKSKRKLQVNASKHLTEDDEVFESNEVKKPKVNYNKNALKVIFLGGIGEIGKNITALEYGDDILVIDCGLAFPGEDLPGVDLVIPDFTYLKENASKVRGIVITHGHEDHIGSLPYLLKDVKVPVYGSKLTLTLLDNKLREHKITGVKEMVVSARNEIKLGCFKVEFVKVNHSIPGAYALSITTPVGIVFHSGDFKIDFTPIDGEKIDLPRIAEIGEKGVTLLLCESTNVERPGYTMSEKSVGEKLEEIFIEHADRRLFVATFSSNIYRVQQIIDLAIKYKRRVAVVGRSMINNIDAGMKIGEFSFDKNVFIDIEKIASLEDKIVLVLCTGSQGEPMSALSRLASGEFSRVEIGDNDTVIFSSSPIPGNENMINKVINNLYKKGAIVIHDNVHTSGHACQEEIKTIHALVKPKFFMPIHGEFRHLKMHKQIAMQLGMEERNIILPSLGMQVELTPNSIKKVGYTTAGQRLIDGYGIGDMDSNVLRDRKQLSEDGICVVVMTINNVSGEVVGDPFIITRGVVYQDEAEAFVQDTKSMIIASLKEQDLRGCDPTVIRNTIRRNVSNFIFKRTKRRPMILTIVLLD